MTCSRDFSEVRFFEFTKVRLKREVKLVNFKEVRLKTGK